MKRTTLYDTHVRLTAKIVSFAGWDMPLYYTGIVHEVEAVRTAAGIFDVSHMGELFVSGTEALALVQGLTTNDSSCMEIGEAQYTLLCDDNGGVIDDLIVYRTDETEYMLVVNASNVDADYEWLQQHNQTSAVCDNRTEAMAIIAVQGPKSQEILQQTANTNIGDLRRMRSVIARIGDASCRVARSGYTGEDGFELFCRAEDSVRIWDRIMMAGESSGITPCGLGARDVLRLEVGYPLHGNEITRETTPVDAHLMWVVKPDKGDFIGREAILNAKASGPKHALVGLSTNERAIPRHGQTVIVAGRAIGSVTSGTFSPTLGRAIALAYVEPPYAEIGSKVDVDIRGRSCACEVVKTPFYRPGIPTQAIANK